jgi:flagellar biosynthetic protein FliP
MRAVPSLGCLVLLPILMMMMATAAPLWARSAAAADSGPLQDLLSSISSPGSSASSSGTSRSAPNRSVPSSSAPWNVVILLTLLTMIPAIVLSMTPFVRLLIVFHFLRQALGTQTAPSNQTLIGLSLVLTFFLMQPVGAAIYSDAVVPLDAGHITMMAALDRSVIPMRHFMLKFAREKDLALFVELAHEPRPARPEDLGMRIVAPAYLLSELQAGFRIGAALFFPFLVIDMVTAAITTSIGMMQLPPVIISTPLKILLFVVVDGWNLLVGSLMRSFS